MDVRVEGVSEALHEGDCPALGAARVDDLLRGPKRVFLRAVFYGWLFAMASVFYLSYSSWNWI